MPTKEQREEFWDWVADGVRQLYYPPIDLNSLFQYAVPRLRRDNEYPYLTEIILDPTVCDVEMYYCYLRYDSLHDDGCVEREEAQGSNEDPALALFWAICKVIKC